MHIIIDADPIVYRAGFAAETHSYDCIVEWPGNKLDQKYFSPSSGKTAGQQMKAFFAENNCNLLAKEKIVECEPLPYALRGVKLTIQACISDATEALKKAEGIEHREAPQITVLLSGPGNFREDIATIKKYKGNRDPSHKPVYYQEIRDYLCTHWGAQVIEGHEADDECSILARMDDRGKTVVCSIDKDLDQIPGYHYDYMKKVFYEILPDEAEYLFWKQILTGDATDNIQGLYKTGDKAADKLLNELLEKTDKESWELWTEIVDLYIINMDKHPDKYPEDIDAYGAALENARLVKMQEYRNQLWNPPGIPDEITT